MVSSGKLRQMLFSDSVYMLWKNYSYSKDSQFSNI